MMPMKRIWPILFVFLLSFSGCSSYGPEELDRLTKEDPEFAKMITARDQVHAQIALIKQNMLVKKRAMDADIDKMHAAYDAYSKQQNLQIEKYGQLIEQNRNFLKREMDTQAASLEAKLKELEGYQKTLSDVKKVMGESKGITISPQERQRWEERILELSEKIRPLSDEIQELKLQIQLKKRKVSFLQ
jgi:uncharacterized protein YdcH (DUF465 family)